MTVAPLRQMWISGSSLDSGLRRQCTQSARPGHHVPELEPLRLYPVTSERIQKALETLRDQLPEAFARGRLDVKALGSLLGQSLHDGQSPYGLQWAGRDEALRASRTPAEGMLCPDVAASERAATLEAFSAPKADSPTARAKGAMVLVATDRAVRARAPLQPRIGPTLAPLSPLRPPRSRRGPARAARPRVRDA